jgi:quinol monooxygenase YgiN
MTKTFTPSTIRVNSRVTTFINVFTVAAANQNALLELLRSQTDRLIRKQPGFLNANFHRSLDGTRVVNYVQWSDQQSSDALHENPEIMTGFAQYQALNVKMDLRYYNVTFASEQQTVIAPQTGLKTLISLLAVKPTFQTSTLEILEREIYPVMAQQAGFISMNLHQSLDGTRVLIYSQWQRSASDDLPALLLQQESLMHQAEGAIAQAKTHFYTVAFTSTSEGLFFGSNV